jgi:uncharacterized phage protein
MKSRKYWLRQTIKSQAEQIAILKTQLETEKMLREHYQRKCELTICPTCNGTGEWMEGKVAHCCMACKGMGKLSSGVESESELKVLTTALIEKIDSYLLKINTE